MANPFEFQFDPSVWGGQGNAARSFGVLAPQQQVAAPQSSWFDKLTSPQMGMALGMVGSALSARDQQSPGYQMGQAAMGLAGNRMAQTGMQGDYSQLGRQMGSPPQSGLAYPVTTMPSVAPAGALASPGGGAQQESPFGRWPYQRLAR